MATIIPIPLTRSWFDLVEHVADGHNLSKSKYAARAVKLALHGGCDRFIVLAPAYRPKTSDVRQMGVSLETDVRAGLNAVAFAGAVAVSSLIRSILVVTAETDLKALPPWARGGHVLHSARSRVVVALPAFALNDANRHGRKPHYHYAANITAWLVQASGELQSAPDDNGADDVMRTNRKLDMRASIRAAYDRSIRQTQAMVWPDTLLTLDVGGAAMDLDWLVDQVGPAIPDREAALVATMRGVAMLVLEKEAKR